MLRRIAIVSMVPVLIALTGGLGTAVAAPSDQSASAVHYMNIYKGKASHGGSGGGVSNLTYHSGPVQTAPVVYLVFWGNWWNSTVTTGTDGSFSYTNQQAKTYVTNFFTNVGGSPWGNVDTQYCQNVAAGTINCGSAGTHVSNPAGQLAGQYVDTSAVPSSPTQSQIAAEAVSAAQHFNYSASSQPNATFFVLTPSGSSMNGFQTSWCAWHSSTTVNGVNLPYAYLPYQPDAGANCGLNFVNATPNSYGNGYFDGYSIVGGHEYAEANTDPVPSGGWVDRRGSENGDKCAWSTASTNISLAGNNYAVQPLWSNAISGCALS